MYYAIFLLGLIFSVLAITARDIMDIFLKLFFICLLLLAFFRYGVGADYFSYNYLFNHLSPDLKTEYLYGTGQQEVLFRLFGSLLKKWGFSYQQYLGVFACINLVYIYKLVKEYSDYPVVSLFLYYSFYYLVWTFSGLRQGVVFSVGIYYLLVFLESKKTMHMFVLTFLLMGIHSSAMILLVLYWVGRRDFRKKHLLFFSVGSLIFSVLPIGNLVIRFGGLVGFDKALAYTTVSGGLNNIFDFQSLVRLLFMVIGYFYYSAFVTRGRRSRILINLYLVSLSLYFLLKFSELTAARMSIYGLMLNILLLPNFYRLHQGKRNQAIYLAFLFMFSGVYFNKELGTMVQTSEMVLKDEFLVPYSTVFEPDRYHFEKYHLKILDD